MALRASIFTAYTATFSLFLLLPGCSHPAGNNIPTSSATGISSPTAPTSAFDAARSFGDLEKQVSFGPRVPERPGHDACLAWMIDRLKAAGANPKRQDFVWTLPDGKKLPMTNVVASIDPPAKKQILLCAHWDSRPTADMEIDAAKKKQPIPGADDGASGVAVLLELAREFSAKHPSVGVQIVLFDGEDYGPSEDRMYLGAQYYAKKPALPKPDYAILIDMIGNKGLSIPREKNSEIQAPEIDNKIWDAAKSLGITQFSDQPGLQIDDDHIPLQNAGWKTVDLIDFNYAPWHTLDDTPDKCSPDSLKAVGDVLAKVIYDEK